MASEKQAYKGAKGNVYKIALNEHPGMVQEIEGFNVREDFGDLEELKNSLIENGQKVPAHGYNVGGIWYLTNGHRRLRAAKMAVDEGHEIVFTILAEPQSSGESDYLISMAVANSGKPLTILEESTLFGRLVEKGWSPAEIARKIGKSNQHIGNALRLLDATPPIREAIAKGRVSATLVIELFRDGLGPDQVEKEVLGALESSGKEKISAKDVPSARDWKKKGLTERQKHDKAYRGPAPESIVDPKILDKEGPIEKGPTLNEIQPIPAKEIEETPPAIEDWLQPPILGTEDRPFVGQNIVTLTIAQGENGLIIIAFKKGDGKETSLVRKGATNEFDYNLEEIDETETEGLLGAAVEYVKDQLL